MRVTVWPKDGVLDPEGRAIARALASLGFDGVAEVRAGKVFDLSLTVADAAAAREQATAMADRLLANGVIERFTVEPTPP
jgi:phosphoribosylformylglycinamidine synthase subunit PurS